MVSKEEVKIEVKKLVEKFDKSDKPMNEETAKKNFIPPSSPQNPFAASG